MLQNVNYWNLMGKSIGKIPSTAQQIVFTSMQSSEAFFITFIKFYMYETMETRHVTENWVILQCNNCDLLSVN